MHSQSFSLDELSAGKKKPLCKLAGLVHSSAFCGKGLFYLVTSKSSYQISNNISRLKICVAA